MSGLSVVYAPSVDGIRKRLFQVERLGSAYADLHQLSLVDEDLKIVLSASCKNLSPDGRLEPAALLRCADESLFIEG